MASETLAEPATPAGGPPADEPEVTPTTPAGEAAGEEKVVEKRKRGRKRKEEGSGNKEEKNRSGNKEVKKRRLETATPSVERPLRERKTVERLVQMSPRKVSVSKLLSIEQGPGTKLKDIPNVSFKISKRKTDDNLQSLHTILFGRKSKAHFLKRNIFQFSGFVWSENEEKQRVRVKEKLDKCNKDRLLDFSEMLDLQIPRATTKKEEITEKLLEFLKSPHATRDLILAEKEKKGKSKRKIKGTSHATPGASSERKTKKHKDATTEVVKEPKRSGKSKKVEEDSSQVVKEDIDVHDSDDKEESDESASTDKEDASDAEKDNSESPDESDQVESEEEDEDEDDSDVPAPSAKESGGKTKAVGTKLKEKTSPATKVSAANYGSRKGHTSEGPKASSKEKAPPLKSSPKTSKNITKSSSRKSSVDESQSVSRSSSRSRKDNKKEHPENENQSPQNKISSKKPGAKSSSKQSTKEQAKVKDGEGAKVGPTREELHSVVSNLLKEVDFNTATLADILKQLGAHFNTDLMNRKSEVKGIIEEVINSMTDDEDGENEEDEEESEGGDPKEEE